MSVILARLKPFAKKVNVVLYACNDMDLRLLWGKMNKKDGEDGEGGGGGG